MQLDLEENNINQLCTNMRQHSTNDILFCKTCYQDGKGELSKCFACQKCNPNQASHPNHRQISMGSKNDFQETYKLFKKSLKQNYYNVLKKKIGKEGISQSEIKSLTKEFRVEEDAEFYRGLTIDNPDKIIQQMNSFRYRVWLMKVNFWKKPTNSVLTRQIQEFLIKQSQQNQIKRNLQVAMRQQNVNDDYYMKRSRYEAKQLKFQNNLRDSVIGYYQNGNNLIEHCICFQTFLDNSTGIIFINQHYQCLYYNQTSPLQLPIQRIKIIFFDKNKDQANPLITLIIQKQTITLECAWDKKYNKSINLNDQIMFPSPIQAYQKLQIKLWIQLNRINRTVSVYTGDITSTAAQCLLSQNFTNEGQNLIHNSNTHVQKFKRPNNFQELAGQIKKTQNKFESIKHFKVRVITACPSKKGQKCKIQLQDFLKLRLMQTDRIYQPILTKYPSVLIPQIPGLFAVPEELRLLYSILEGMNIKKLPQFTRNETNQDIQAQYNQWTHLSSAIQHSLTTPFGYINIKSGNPYKKQKDLVKQIPIGILNHLFKWKVKRQWTPFNIAKYGLSNSSIFQHIYKERGGYIRLQLLPHEGISPGSMAVFEIWPPYSCSSIHNHGNSYGLIKVLSGSIRVQNYMQLNFQQFESKPYLQNDYHQDQYTWLSEESYGIHRLTNLHSQCCLTLQSYYHYKNVSNTNQYFSFLEKQTKTKIVNGKSQKTDDYYYTEYFPQNDWQNYLAEAKLQKSLQQLKNSEKEDKLKDILFIRNVISYYQLADKDNKINISFQKFAMTLKKQYDMTNTIAKYKQ